MHLSVRNMYEFRDIAAKIHQGVKFDGTLGFTKASPRKQGKAEINSAGVQGVNRFMEINAEIFRSIKGLGNMDECLCEVGVDAPIAFFIGIGYCTSRNLGADAHVI